MKVLMVVKSFRYGGTEQFLINVFENWKNKNIQFDVLTLFEYKDDWLTSKLGNLGVGYSTLNLGQCSIIKRQFKHYKELYNVLKNSSYDVIHFHPNSFTRILDLAIAKAAGINKRIVHSHFAGMNSGLSAMVRPLRFMFDLFATDFCACSDEAAKYMFSRKRVSDGKYHVVINGVNVGKYAYSDEQRRKVRKECEIDEETLVIGHIGRLVEEKNHSFILDVFKEIHKLNIDSKLLLVGEGKLRTEIEAQIKELRVDNDVIMYGASPEVGALLSAMDVFMFPSWHEGLGFAVIEAQCNGLPCYVSEHIPNDACITSNVHKLNISYGARYWAERILEYHKRVDETHKIAEAGYDINTTIRQLEGLYIDSRS